MTVGQLRKLIEKLPEMADVNLSVKKKIKGSDNIEAVVYVAKLESAELADGGVWLEGSYEGTLNDGERAVLKND